MRYLTYADMIDTLVEWSRAHTLGLNPKMQKRAVLDAYDEVAQAWEWSFLFDVERVFVYAAQSDGTVEYTHSTRQLEITDDTWPTWATAVNGAAVYLDDVLCDVAERTSSTILTLNAVTNPKADVDAESDYTLFQKFLPLPDDFLSMERPLGEEFYRFGKETTLADLQARHRYSDTTGALRYWALGPQPNGGMAIWIYPAMDADKRIDVPYRKRPRNLRITGHASSHYQGTVSVSGTAVTGDGTAFTSAMVGSVLRVSDDTTVPTGLEGDSPYAEEVKIASVANATALTLVESGTAATDVGYRISDPIELERTVWDAVVACAKKRVATAYGLKDRRSIEEDFRDAMFAAKGADTPSSPPAVARPPQRQITRLADQA